MEQNKTTEALRFGFTSADIHSYSRQTNFSCLPVTQEVFPGERVDRPAELVPGQIQSLELRALPFISRREHFNQIPTQL